MKRTKHAILNRKELFHNAGASTAVLEDCVEKIISMLPVQKLDYTGPRNRPAANYLIDKEIFLRAKYGDEAYDAAFSGHIKDPGVMKNMTQAWNRFVNGALYPHEDKDSAHLGNEADVVFEIALVDAAPAKVRDETASTADGSTVQLPRISPQSIDEPGEQNDTESTDSEDFSTSLEGGNPMNKEAILIGGGFEGRIKIRTVNTLA